MTPQEALAQAIRDAAPNLPRKDLIIADPYTESAIAILDALRKVPGGRWVIVDRDEWDVLCERICTACDHVEHYFACEECGHPGSENDER